MCWGWISILQQVYWITPQELLLNYVGHWKLFLSDNIWRSWYISKQSSFCELTFSSCAWNQVWFFCCLSANLNSWSVGHDYVNCFIKLFWDFFQCFLKALWKKIPFCWNNVAAKHIFPLSLCTIIKKRINLLMTCSENPMVVEHCV